MKKHGGTHFMLYPRHPIMSQYPSDFEQSLHTMTCRQDKETNFLVDEPKIEDNSCSTSIEAYYTFGH